MKEVTSLDKNLHNSLLNNRNEILDLQTKLEGSQCVKKLEKKMNILVCGHIFGQQVVVQTQRMGQQNHIKKV